MMDPLAELYGRLETHLVPIPGDEKELRIHRDALSPWLAMQAKAEQAGFDLRLCSSFRSFDAQLAIWNAKATGRRSIYDRKGRVLDVESASPEEILQAILRWSALPGASRHHWGTDLDVYDGRALEEGAELRLEPSEFEGGGRFAPLHDWLDEHLEYFGFYRPYDLDRGGVSPERWHLSFAPRADLLFESHSIERLAEILEESEMALKTEVLARFPGIYGQYFRAISRPA